MSVENLLDKIEDCWVRVEKRDLDGNLIMYANEWEKDFSKTILELPVWCMSIASDIDTPDHEPYILIIS